MGRGESVSGYVAAVLIQVFPFRIGEPLGNVVDVVFWRSNIFSSILLPSRRKFPLRTQSPMAKI